MDASFYNDDDDEELAGILGAGIAWKEDHQLSGLIAWLRFGSIVLRIDSRSHTCRSRISMTDPFVSR